MPDYTNVPRDSRRVPIATKVQFKFDRFSGFLSEYSSNISPTGMYIVTRTPEPPGRVLDLEFRLGDGFEIIKGKGEVVWTRTVADGPHRPPGMGLRFLELSPGSKDLIYRIVDQYVLEGGTPFDLTKAGAAAGAPVLASAPASGDDLLAGLPPLDLEPDPFPDLEPEQLKESSSNVLPWRRPPDLRAVEDPEPGLEPAAGVFAMEDSDRRPDPLSLASPAPFASSASEVPAAPAPAPPADLFASYLPKPAGPPEPPMSRTLSSLAGSASARPERRLAPWVLGIVLLAVLAAAGILFRGQILGLVGLGGEDEEIAAAPPQALPLPRRQPAAPPPAAGAAPGLVTELEPASPPAAPQQEPEIVEEAPLPEVVQRKPAPEPAAGPAVSAVERITLEPTAGSTDVVLWGNGVFQPQSYSQSRMEGPPRALIRIIGVRRPFSPSRIPAGTPQLRQVRTGYHQKAGGNELHVVLDLAGPGVKVTRIDRDGQRLRIHLEGP